MKCADLGVLQAYLDDELTREHKKTVMQHLETCDICRSYVEELKEMTTFTSKELSEPNIEMDVDQAWARFERELTVQESKESDDSQSQVQHTMTVKGWNAMKKKTKRWIASGIVAATLFGSFAIPQVQVAAGQFLSLFRVNQMELIKVTKDDLNEVENWMRSEEGGSFDLKGLGKIEMSEAGKAHQFYPSAEAAENAGYDIHVPTGYEVNNVNISPSFNMTFKLDVKKANDMLDQLGLDTHFPEQLNENPFTIRMTDAMSVHYSNGDVDFNYFYSDTPEIGVPEGISVFELRQTLLSLPFIPENVKRQLATIDPLQGTLPIPYVDEPGTTVENVIIGEGKGYVVKNRNNTKVVWQTDEGIHQLQLFTHNNGESIDVSEIKSIAEQLN